MPRYDKPINRDTIVHVKLFVPSDENTVECCSNSLLTKYESEQVDFTYKPKSNLIFFRFHRKKTTNFELR